MAGNVEEWCEDWYDSDHKARVLRGGSWSHYAMAVRVTFRGWDTPATRQSFRGFRCAYSP